MLVGLSDFYPMVDLLYLSRGHCLSLGLKPRGQPVHLLSQRSYSHLTRGFARVTELILWGPDKKSLRDAKFSIILWLTLLQNHSLDFRITPATFRVMPWPLEPPPCLQNHPEYMQNHHLASRITPKIYIITTFPLESPPVPVQSTPLPLESSLLPVGSPHLYEVISGLHLHLPSITFHKKEECRWSGGVCFFHHKS